MLWREDLDVFLVKLEDVEEKERQDEASTNKKTTKALVSLILFHTLVCVNYVTKNRPI